jgi:hypothetical protein
MIIVQAAQPQQMAQSLVKFPTNIRPKNTPKIQTIALYR